MAELVPIQGSSEQAKIRNPLAVIGLIIITIGIYYFVWYYKINKEMAEIGRARGTEELGTSPATSLMAILIGWIIIVPPFVSLYRTCSRVQKTHQLMGSNSTLEPGLVFLLALIISPVGDYIIQMDMNKALEAQAGGGAVEQVPERV